MNTCKNRLSAAATGVLDKITEFYAGASGVIMVLITLITFVDVVLRLTVGSPTTWGFSVTIIGMVWLVLLSLPLNVKNGDQLTVTLLIQNFSEQTQALLRVVSTIVSFVFLIILGYYGLLYTSSAVAGNVMSSDLLHYPVWILRIAFPLCVVIGCLQMIRVTIKDIADLIGNKLSKAGTWSARPWVVTLVFICCIILGVYLITVEPIVGIIILILILLFGGAPIAFGMGFIGSIGMFICNNGFTSLALVPACAEPMLTNFIMLAVPMFLFAGIILEKSGIGELLFDFCAKWFGFLPGGLAVATILACALFSAMTGVSMAVAATISIIAVKALSSRGYPKELIYGSIGGGALGSFIPPSIGLVLYGYMTGKSVGKLFMAATVPAIIVVLLYVGYTVFYSMRNSKMRTYREQKVSWADRVRSLKKAFPALLMPVIVLGGIYAGFFTPTEASAVLVVYALVLGFAMKKITIKDLLGMIKSSVAVASRMMIVAVGATILTYLITRLGVAQDLATSVATMEAPKWIIYALLIMMFTILGMFFDGMTITILTVPVLAPLLPTIGLDPIVFGILLVMLVETAAITPPVGMNLFVIQSVSKDKLSIIAKGNIPFALILLGTTILIMFIPDIALWLPKLFGK